MTLEIWMIVGVGLGFAAGFGAVTILLLGLHAEVRRLTKLAEAAHRSLLRNLEHALEAAAATPAKTPVHHIVAHQPEPTLVPESPRAVAAAATALRAIAEPAPPALELVPELKRLADATACQAVAAPDEDPWSPDRRLLVMRLAGRGRNPEQIAAALQIPQKEVEKFLEVNQLIP